MRRNIGTAALTLTLVCTLLPSAGGIADVIVSGLVGDLSRHFLARCVYLLYEAPPRGGAVQWLVRVRKMLERQNIATGVFDVQTMVDRMEDLTCTGSFPVQVLLSSGSRARHVLSQITKGHHLSSFTWMLFLTTGDTASFFHDVHVPFDCRFLVARPGAGQLVTLTEVYQASTETPLKEERYGSWNGSKLNWPPIKLWERRHDLQGVTFTAGVVVDYSISLINSTRVGGFHGRLWHSLERRLNFTSRFVEPKDRAWGTIEGSGYFNGVVGLLQNRTIDVAASMLSVNPHRAAVVDFTAPLYSVHYHVFIKQPRVLSLGWGMFLVPFDEPLRLATAAFVLGVAGVGAVAATALRRAGMLEDASPGDAVLAAVSIICMQGAVVKSSTASMRLIVVTAYLSAVVLVASYSAMFFSFLAVQRVPLPFTDLEGLLEDGSYMLGAKNRSSLVNYFSTTGNDAVRNVYEKLMQPDDFPLRDNEGLQRVCGGNYAFMMSTAFLLRELAKVRCKVVSLPDYSLRNIMAIAFVKRSPYLGIFRHMLMRLRSGGTLRRDRLGGWVQPPPGLVRRSLQSMELEDVAPLFLVLSVLVLASLVLLGAECLVVRLKRAQARSGHSMVRVMT